MKPRVLIYALAVSTAVFLLYGCPEAGSPSISKTSLKAGGLIIKVNDAIAPPGSVSVLENIILDGELVLGRDFNLSITQRPTGANTQSVSIDNSAGTVIIADIADTGDSGTYTITATGIGDYTYTLEDTFELTISPKTALNNTDFSLKIDPVSVQTGHDAVHSAVIAGTLTAGTDYTLSIAAPPNATVGSVNIDNEGVIAITFHIGVADSGTYTVTATGKGLYTGAVRTSFLITVTGSNTQSIADNMTAIYDDMPIDVWTEGRHLPTLNAEGLTAGIDYFMTVDGPAKEDVVSISHDGEITISNAIEVGDSGIYTVTITGANNYSGSFTRNFTLTVLPRDINTTDITLDVADFVARAGENMFHDVTVGGSLQASKDYTLSLTAPQDANANVSSIVNESSIFFNSLLALEDNGIYTVTATGNGNYTNSIDKTFNVTVTQSLSLASLTLELTGSEKSVTAGTPDTYTVTVNRGALTLTDYTLSISGPGNKLSITDNDDGTATVSIGDTAMDDAGTYTVLAEGTGDYTGSVSVQFVLSVVNAENTIALDASILGIEFDTLQATALTESTHKATITGSLTAGTDYLLSIVDTASVITSVMTIADDGTIAISGKVGVGDAGEYKILAIGINNYTGTVEQSFQMTVAQYPLSTVEGFSVTANDVEMTAKMAKSYSNFITISTSTLIPGTDYDLEIQGLGQTTSLTITDNFNGTATITAPDTLSMSDAGSYSIKAVGKNNYTGEISSGDFNVQINPRDIASIENFTFSADTTNVYALTAKSYSDVVSVGAGLVPSTDYTLSISNRPSGSNPSVLYVNNDGSITASKDISAEDMGEYTITLTARNNYSGTLDTQLVIILEHLDFTTIDGYALVSKNIELSALTAAYYVNVISIGNTGLRPGVDYSMAITSRPAGANSDAISIDNSGTLRATAALVAGDAGTYTVEITGLGNYTGSASVDFVLTVN